MIDEIDFFDRRSGSGKKTKPGDDWNELKKLRQTQKKPGTQPGKKDPRPPSAENPEK